MIDKFVFIEEDFIYDENGNLIHSKASDGKETFSSYNSKGMRTYYRNSNGIEFKFSYDSENRCIYTACSQGYEKWNEYDGYNLIHSRYRYTTKLWYQYDITNGMTENITDYEEWFTYDNRNNLIHYKDSKGIIKSYEYDVFNNVTMKNINGKIERIIWEYNKDNKLVYSASSNGTVCEYCSFGIECERKYGTIIIQNTYDEFGHVIHTEDISGNSIDYKYDEKGNLIHAIHSDGTEEWYEYDSNNNKIHVEKKILNK